MHDAKLLPLKRWYNGIDKRGLSLFLLLILVGNLFVFIASPIVATRIGTEYNMFIIKNIIFSTASFSLIVFLSFLSTNTIKKASLFSFCVLFVLMILVFFIGTTNKGAKRWIYFFGFSLQPSEAIKPFFIILVSQILTTIKDRYNLLFATILYLAISTLLFLQPDIGLLFLITTIFFTELFLILDLKVKYVILIAFMFVMLFTSLYILYPHFNYRINQYFSILFKDNVKNTFQVENSLNAFANGGLTGKGLWGGGIKNNIPDGHTDFIFSVIGEELGCLFCVFLLGIYFYITLKFITKTINSKDNFKNISIISLSVQFLLQALINICSTLALIPTKGMTLPLISYGGSSMMGTAFTLGFLLALSRKEYGEIINENVIIEI